MDAQKNTPGKHHPDSLVALQDLSVPDASDWSGLDQDDLDAPYFRDLFFGKSIVQVQEYFGEGKSIERSAELLVVPRRVFQYYIHAFAHFLKSEAAAGDSDSASPFLGLLLAREEVDPGSVCSILHELDETLVFVASNQVYFGADPDIYGDFRQRVRQVYAACDAELPRQIREVGSGHGAPSA